MAEPFQWQAWRYHQRFRYPIANLQDFPWIPLMIITAISHLLVIAIPSISYGSPARHPHDTVVLLFSCRMMTQHHTFSMHPLSNFHRSNNQYTHQRPKPRFHSSQKCHDLASILMFATVQLPLWSAVSLRLSSLYSDAVAVFTDTQLLLSLSLVDSSWLAFLPTLEGYSENIPLKSSSLTSVTAKFVRFQMKGPNKTVLSSQRFNYGTDLQSGNWAASLVATDSCLTLQCYCVDSTRVFESSIEISRPLKDTRQSIYWHTTHRATESNLEPQNDALPIAVLMTLIPH